MARNPGRLLTREELIQALWPDSYVEEGNLSVHIFQVRKALGTAGDTKGYIQTVPKKGYRFNAEVKVIDHPSNGFAGEALELHEAARDETAEDKAAPHVGDGGAEVSPTSSRLRPDGLPDDRPQRIHSRSWLLVAAGAGCLLVVVVILARVFFTRQEMRGPGTLARLTSFSPELFVSAASISPDGRTLAYANSVGMFLEDIPTKETRHLRTPASDLRISHISWFPDGARLLVTGAGADDLTQSVWILPAKETAAPERVGAFQSAVISPDGSQIALLRGSDGRRELFLLPTGGGQLRRIAAVPEEQDLGGVFWSADGRRLNFVVRQWDAQLRNNKGFIRSVNLSTGKSVDILSAPNLNGDAIILAGGRLIYGQLLGANPAGSYGTELREARVDTKTSRVVANSVSLGRWTEQLAGLSSSADGRRLVFSTVLSQHSVYEADLEEGKNSLSRVRRLTLGKGREDYPRAWAPDSKAIFFDSNRNGKWEIFRQALDQISDEPYLQSANDEFSPRMSPDDRFLLYLDRPREWREPAPVRLMRVSTIERFPQFVLETSGYSEWGLRFDCAQTKGGPCVLAQQTGNEVVFRQFDPESGFGSRSEVLRIAAAANQKIFWTLAPDGSRLAWIISDGLDATIHVVSLRQPGSDQTSRESDVALKHLSRLHALNWSRDGKGWYVTTRLPVSWKIVYANGVRNQVLLQGQGTYAPEAWPSPDGRHLAFSEMEQDSNVWMLENF